uniref:Uncharacterized protein n=1 Tax=Panagrolaimus sp. PS1159 TaxID=55785 RepID=A0AC35FIQ4_9BILA
MVFIFVSVNFRKYGIFPFDDVREFPNIDEIRVPFMLTWVFTDVCKIKELNLVYCLFSSKFEEICFRRIHHARLLKVQN